jgi:uncharacterized cupredoxin-like copper-binding protein
MVIKQRLAAACTGLLGAAALVASLALNGCKDDPVTPSDNNPSTTNDTIYVTMRDGIIEMPMSLTARDNAIFKITNKGTKEHQFEVEIHEGPRKGEEKLSKVMSPGQSDVLVWELLPVEYEFYCPHQPGDEHKNNGEKVIFSINP